jgi:hypothetical protein
MEELIQERLSVIYYKNKANRMGYGEKYTNLFSIFNIKLLPKIIYCNLLQMMGSPMIHQTIFCKRITV